MLFPVNWKYYVCDQQKRINYLKFGRADHLSKLGPLITGSKSYSNGSHIYLWQKMYMHVLRRNMLMTRVGIKSGIPGWNFEW